MLNAYGVESVNSKRVVGPNFCTYFGSYVPIKGVSENNDKVNDVILPETEGFGARHFQIKFSASKNSYLLKDLGDGSGTFVKVDRDFVLKNGQIVSFGENHMVVGIIIDKQKAALDPPT